MEREIRFRGWSIKKCKWISGYLGTAMSRTPETGFNKYVIVQCLEWLNDDDFYSAIDNYAVYPNTIGQFTGLKDINWRDIYEGDIIRSERDNDIKHIVLYDKESASFCAICIDANMGTELETRCHITQEWIYRHPKSIIGNIHDNPEMIETK